MTGLPADGWITRKRARPRCGARCRDGHSCRAPAVWDTQNDCPRNGRCRMHGGLSTGPKTWEGKVRSLANLKQFRGRLEQRASVFGQMSG
ncbi:MAG: HGGxSTG domain-containing protein [Alphaproteobacteria bacterium]